jgi:hypothetical protein
MRSLNAVHRISHLGSRLTEAHKVALSLIVLESIFVLHHLYGKYFVYRDGIRLVSILVSLPVLAMTLTALWLSQKIGSRIAVWLFLGLVVGV